MKRLAPSPYSPGPEVSMACLERALTRCDTARCAVIGLHMRRHLRYFTPVFSVAFESFGIFRVTCFANLGSNFCDFAKLGYKDQGQLDKAHRAVDLKYLRQMNRLAVRAASPRKETKRPRGGGSRAGSRRSAAPAGAPADRPSCLCWLCRSVPPSRGFAPPQYA